MSVGLRDLLRKTGLKSKKLQRLAFADAIDDSTRDLKIVEGRAACRQPSGNPGHITEGRFGMTDLISHIETEGKSLGEEVLQAASKVPGECGLTAVGPAVHKIYIQLRRLPVVAETNFVPGSAQTRSDIRHPFFSDRGEVIDIISGKQ